MEHDFLPVAGHPDDDECTYRTDGTDATYCGQPRLWHDHHPNCYQNTGTPLDLPDDLCDCRILRTIASATAKPDLRWRWSLTARRERGVMHALTCPVRRRWLRWRLHMPFWRDDKTAQMLGIAQYGCRRCGRDAIEERNRASTPAEETR